MNKEIEEIWQQIGALHKRLKEIEKACPHKNYKSEYHSNTGNYDQWGDTYWVNVNCLDCGKFMQFDSEEDRVSYVNFAPLDKSEK